MRAAEAANCAGERGWEINLKTAWALGLTISQSVLARADELRQ